jgi:uncharacterized protein YwqG
VDLDHLLKRAARAGLSHQANFLASAARPSIEMKLVKASPKSGLSKLGGIPDLPVGESWPESSSDFPYHFLGQIDFANLPDFEGTPFPSSGMLSLFYLYDEDGEADWDEPGYVVAVSHPEVAELVAVPSPDQPEPGRSVALSFKLGWDLPQDEYQAADWPFSGDDEEAFTEHLSWVERVTADHLLGYPRHNTLAYDPSPGEDWVPLLTVASHDPLGWCWGDGDNLMIFIERSRLEKADFSNLSCHTG